MVDLEVQLLHIVHTHLQNTADNFRQLPIKSIYPRGSLMIGHSPWRKHRHCRYSSWRNHHLWTFILEETSSSDIQPEGIIIIKYSNWRKYHHPTFILEKALSGRKHHHQTFVLEESSSNIHPGGNIIIRLSSRRQHHHQTFVLEESSSNIHRGGNIIIFCPGGNIIIKNSSWRKHHHQTFVWKKHYHRTFILEEASSSDIHPEGIIFIIVGHYWTSWRKHHLRTFILGEASSSDFHPGRSIIIRLSSWRKHCYRTFILKVTPSSFIHECLPCQVLNLNKNGLTMWQERRFVSNPRLRHLSLAYNKFRSHALPPITCIAILYTKL